MYLFLLAQQVTEYLFFFFYNFSFNRMSQTIIVMQSLQPGIILGSQEHFGL